MREHAAKDGTVLRRKTFVVGYRPKGIRQYRRIAISVYGPVTVEQPALQLSVISPASAKARIHSKQSALRAAQTVREFGERFLTHVDDRRKRPTAGNIVDFGKDTSCPLSEQER